MRHPLPTGIEFHLMISGEPYLSNDPELVAARARARSVEFRYNHTPPEESAAYLRDIATEPQAGARSQQASGS